MDAAFGDDGGRGRGCELWVRVLCRYCIMSLSFCFGWRRLRVKLKSSADFFLNRNNFFGVVVEIGECVEEGF